ncbi:MAG TPA: hypothetical protein ENN51_08110 [candidate division WOR-3 bacterium]|uniref:Lipoprotein n=1 Tax=candidate division WOR-3 bacterium TaxID=2052148 RepID=A0A7V0T6T2_UNCW3|nr:hypothetical protein [candidate division WOR-3 bacterium]
MKAAIPALAGLMLMTTACEPSPNPATLREAFFSQVIRLHGITSFEIQKETITFEMGEDKYTCVVTETSIVPIEDPRYTHMGSLECEFRLDGQRIPYFDDLVRVGIAPDAIVAAWDSESKRWRFDVEFETY